jgi:MinD superfamily P-loop ATPase
MLHATLGAASANSGKLVSTLREQARRTAAEEGIDLVLIDGSPGIGCPVIASVTGASLVLVVTEPTLAGRHDMERVLELVKGFGIPSAVCVNRADIDAELADSIEGHAAGSGALVVPRVRLDRAVTDAQMRKKAVVELEGSLAARDIEKGWKELCQILDRLQTS